MLSRLRKYFISGLVIFLPLALTIFFFMGLLAFTDGLLGKFIQPVFRHQFGFYFRGLSIIVGVYLIILMGFLATNYFGGKLHRRFEALITRLPFFRQVYPALKEMTVFLFSRDKVAFQQVVFIEYPRKGIYSLGFLTGAGNKQASKFTNKEMCNVFVPSTPSPLTGFVVVVPVDEVVFADLTVEEAVRFIVSGGVIGAGAKETLPDEPSPE